MTVAHLAFPDLPELPRLVFENRYGVVASMESFEDRIGYAAETVQALHDLLFYGLCTPDQHAAMLRRLRATLQADLGVIVAGDAWTVRDQMAAQEARKQLEASAADVGLADTAPDAQQDPAGAGRSPAGMAHGCAALAVSAGSAPAPSPTREDGSAAFPRPVATLLNRSLGGDTS